QPRGRRPAGSLARPAAGPRARRVEALAAGHRRPVALPPRAAASPARGVSKLVAALAAFRRREDVPGAAPPHRPPRAALTPAAGQAVADVAGQRLGLLHRFAADAGEPLGVLAGAARPTQRKADEYPRPPPPSHRAHVPPFSRFFC